ncbi:MAG: two-component sensor histidine kinase [Glaciihabitans sp.]|nr:two-component sensor histidine kinase [Glaciihabitans sp.]
MRAVPYACALVVMAFFGVVLGWIAWNGPDRRWWAAGDLAIGVSALVLLRWRHRAPFTVAVITAVVTVLSTTAIGPAYVAYVSLVKRRPRKRILVVAALIWVAGAIYSAEDGISQQLLLAVTANTLSLVALTAAGLYLRSRVDLENERTKRRAEEQRHRRAELEQVRLNERATIAREMHDVLAHRISLLSLHAAALAHRTDLSPDEVRLAATVIHESAQQSLTELRATLGSLRDDEVTAPPQPSWEQLPVLLAEVRAAGQGVQITAEVDAEAAVPAQVGRHAYRIVQEALTNARKHAPGAITHIRVSGRPGEQLRLSISNTETRRPPTGHIGGLGLIGLAERVTMVGGTLSTTSSGGQFVLDASLPWEATS